MERTVIGTQRMLARARSALAREDGAATAEYAVATMAAVGFAGLLVVITRPKETNQCHVPTVTRRPK